MSKLLAGGLSAGVFLLWWPVHFPDQGLEWLVLRGVLWTLCFEVLLLSIAPVERMVTVRLGGVAGARVAALAPPLQGRARVPLALGAAAAALSVPIALLTDVQPPRSHAARAAPRPPVVRQVIVKRPVVRREVIVREVPGPALAASAPERATPPAATGSPPRAARTARTAAPRTVARPPRRSTTVRAGTESRTPATQAPARTPAPAAPQPAALTPSSTAPAADAEAGPAPQP